MAIYLRNLLLAISLMSVFLISGCGDNSDGDSALAPGDGDGDGDGDTLTLFTMEDGSTLASFSPATPGTIQTVTITGTRVLPDNSNEYGVDIDVRPGTSELYMSGSDGGLYTLNPATGMATLVGDMAVPDTFVKGLDWNPVIDKLRVLNDGNKHYVLNADGSLSATGTDLAFATGDENEGLDVDPEGLAYTPGSTGVTTAYLIATGTTDDTLAILGGPDGTPEPNSGVVTTVGALGISVSGSSSYGFNIDNESGIAYLIDPNLGTGTAETFLHSVNLETGISTLLGEIGTNTGYSGLAVLSGTTQVPGDGDGDGDGDTGTDTCLPGDPSGMLCLSQMCATPGLGPTIVEAAGGSCGTDGGTTLDPSGLCAIPTIGPAIAEQAGVNCES